MKQLTTSIYTFPKLIEGEFLYVDKTGYIYDIIKPASAQYFLSRPRRFGKSLMISTLKCIFQGRRELFKGLAIEQMDYDWETYPVIHLDMGSTATENVEDTETMLWEMLDDVAHGNSIKLTKKLLFTRFQQLIEKSAAEKPVVILIDEYDKPLLGHIGKDTVGKVQNLLKNFYSVIKTTEAAQRFVMITGVSKFSKVSIFSDLNNLTDLTMSPHSATLLGYTQQELESNFEGYIQRLAQKQNLSYEQTLDMLRDWYNGYRFHHQAESVYNPVSVMKCFQEKEFQNYWFETGTPAFLLELLKKNPVDLGDMEASETSFSTYEPAALRPLPLLVQTGYLTIKDVRMLGRSRQYTLGYPNFEIESSFSEWLARYFTELHSPEFDSTLRRIYDALQESRVEDMLENMKTFFASVPNTITIENEKYYQTIFFTVLKVIGTMVEAEVNTNIGRIDAVLKTAGDIYIFEFKLRGSAEEAMAQIKEKGYADQYGNDSRRCTLIGVEFDRTARNIGKWIICEAG